MATNTKDNIITKINYHKLELIEYTEKINGVLKQLYINLLKEMFDLEIGNVINISSLRYGVILDVMDYTKVHNSKNVLYVKVAYIKRDHTVSTYKIIEISATQIGKECNNYKEYLEVRGLNV